MSVRNKKGDFGLTLDVRMHVLHRYVAGAGSVSKHQIVGFRQSNNKLQIVWDTTISE